MASCLIGSTGFVGSTLLQQIQFDELYRSTNIAEIAGKSFNLLVCAGAPAAKWKANQDPEADWSNLERLMSCLRETRAERVVLISTVDVYRSPAGQDETTPADAVEPYGKHRYALEEFVYNEFSSATVIRLPGLVGTGLRKNFLYDLAHHNALHVTHADSVFQFYDMGRLWSDVERVLAAEEPLVNFATAPVRAGDVAEHCFDMSFTNRTEKPAVRYDMHTRFAGLFGHENPYMLSTEEVYEAVRRYAVGVRAA